MAHKPEPQHWEVSCNLGGKKLFIIDANG